MAARRFEHCECAIHIRAKICLGLLDGWNDVRTRREMEHALRASRGGFDRGFVRNVRFDDLQTRVALMLLKIGTPADDEAIEDAHVPAPLDQPIDEMTADETCAARYKIDHNTLADGPVAVFVKFASDSVVCPRS